MQLRSSLIFLCLFAATAQAQVRPNGKWRELESEHFRVVFEEGSDSLAKRAAAIGEAEWQRLNSGLIAARKGKIDIVLTDATDITNGYATPFPSKRIVIFARPPVEELSLQIYNDWLELVITHELTHIFHTDYSGKFGRAMRSVFGRLPTTWPIFPILEQPRWNLEGLATMVESKDSQGRIDGTTHEMILRTAIIENSFDPIDRVSGDTPIWPGGTRAYFYGAHFMEYIRQRFGDSAHTQLVKKTAGSVLPASWRMDAIAKKATGNTYTELYADWKKNLQQKYDALYDSLRTTPVTHGESITHTGRWALHPRVSPDGKLLALADENGRNVSATRIIDLTTKEERRIRRNGLNTIAWLPDNSFVTSQYDLKSPYEIFSDLYHGDDRITHNARAESPDVRADGRIVFVQNIAGTNRLMLSDMHGNTSVLVERSPDAQWTLPHWSPDGSRIAVQRWTRGINHEILVIDTAGKLIDEINTDGIDAAPAWGPNGWIIFSSDYTGITNLYAWRNGELRQITNMVTGAFYPDVSPDNKSIYFSAYHADGFHIEKITLDTTAWLVKSHHPIIPSPHHPITIEAPSHKYSALRSALPKFWIPTAYRDSITGTFYGVSTAGFDDLTRHEYSATVAYAPDTKRSEYNVQYTYAGLGVPLISADVSREWLRTQTSVRHEDLAALDVVFPFRRWRTSTTLRVGAEHVHIRGETHMGVHGGIGFSNTKRPQYAISAEDGVRASVFARHRFDWYSEVTARTAAYKSVDAFGFAHQVIALHANGITRSAGSPFVTEVGGAEEFLAVRGFSSGALLGRKAWSATAEYRIPLAMVGRGSKLRPLFLDRVHGALFYDVGGTDTKTISSVGAEISAITQLLTWNATMPLRLGVAYPVRGDVTKRVYLAFGQNF